MGSCKECFHQPVCFKQGIRKKITPQGFELVCPHFKNKADIQEVKHGKWIPMELLDKFKCSVCGNKEGFYKDNYCSICGAKMTRGDAE